MSPELQTYILRIFRVLRLVQPPLQQWLQLAHVLEAQLQSFKAANGCLAEHFTYKHKACYFIAGNRLLDSKTKQDAPRRSFNIEMNLPYKLPSARPTSAWVKPKVMRLCFSSLANCSSSSVERLSCRTGGKKLLRNLDTFVDDDSRNM